VAALLELAQVELRAGRLDAAEEGVVAAESVIRMAEEMKATAVQFLPHATFATISASQQRLLGAVRLSLRAAIALLRAERATGPDARQR
jgi:hypothetical protein